MLVPAILQFRLQFPHGWEPESPLCFQWDGFDSLILVPWFPVYRGNQKNPNPETQISERT